MDMDINTNIEISDEEWVQYVLDSPLYHELLEDDPEQLILILSSYLDHSRASTSCCLR